MLFSSVTFLSLFLPFFLLTYFLCPQKTRNIILLVASYVFFAWGAPKFVFVLFISSWLDYQLSQLIEKYREQPKLGPTLLTLAITICLVQLIYVKYTGFILDNLKFAFSHLHLSPIIWTQIILPLGISFITFHRISYLVDVYRGITPPKSFTQYALYIALFPPLIAGPIIRFHDISDQLSTRSRRADINLIASGAYRFCIGLAKKVIIADQLGWIADKVFAMPDINLNFTNAWIGIISYSFQIYFDFSGYSDMAIGLSLIFGFRLRENFNHPYIAQNISEFWQRWHISLSRWMKDYLYIPLGGNRVTAWRNYLNLWFVFLCSGIWHGASWNFLAWGAYHGFFITLDKLFWQRISQHLPKAINIFITFIIVVFSWVLFRSPTFHYALGFAKHLLAFTSISWPINPLGTAIDTTNHYARWFVVVSDRQWLILWLACLVSFLPAVNLNFHHLQIVSQTSWQMINEVLRSGYALILFLIGFMWIESSGFHPFIYFRF